VYKFASIAVLVYVLGSGPLHAQSAVQPVYDGQPGFGRGEPYYDSHRQPYGAWVRTDPRIVGRPGTPGLDLQMGPTGPIGSSLNTPWGAATPYGGAMPTGPLIDGR